jgi:DNA-binding NtrC family response regulator
MSRESSAHMLSFDGEIADNAILDNAILDVDNAPDAIQQQPAQILFRVGMTMEEVERQMLLKTLAFFNNHKPKAAQALGISLKTVYNRLARFGLVDDASETAAMSG